MKGKERGEGRRRRVKDERGGRGEEEMGIG